MKDVTFHQDLWEDWDKFQKRPAELKRCKKHINFTSLWKEWEVKKHHLHLLRCFYFKCSSLILSYLKSKADVFHFDHNIIIIYLIKNCEFYSLTTEFSCSLFNCLTFFTTLVVIFVSINRLSNLLFKNARVMPLIYFAATLWSKIKTTNYSRLMLWCQLVIRIKILVSFITKCTNVNTVTWHLMLLVLIQTENLQQFSSMCWGFLVFKRFSWK